MKVEKDFVEFLGLLNKNQVNYLIIGAYAVGFYGYPRFTKDIDILVEPLLENARKIIMTLKEFGISGPDLTEDDFSQKDNIIQLGYDPVRIDLLTSIEGFRFEDIWKNKKVGSYGSQKVFFIGFEELIESKKKAGRDVDLVDIRKLTARNG
ncbi:MAG: hypothetical protein ACE5IH_04325 [Thermodesulfobacteriota bacterium]